MEAVSEAKYEKLAAEYAKLKSHISSLKRAYLDEQAECNSIKDEVKEKDQWMRKCEGEVDSLTFRNRQLSSRVQVLQEELTALEKRPDKHKHKRGVSSGTYQVLRSTSVYDEELHGKMEENARLQAQLQEVSMTYERQMVGLEERLRESSQDGKRQAEVVSSLQQSSGAVIGRLEQEKEALEERLSSQLTHIHHYRSRAELAEERLGTERYRLQTALRTADKIMADQLPFVDTKHKTLNMLNLPTYDRKHQTHARELISQAAAVTLEFTQGLCKFFIYTEQRSRIFPADNQTARLSPVNDKLCTLLHEHLGYLQAVDECVRHFSQQLGDNVLTVLETATDLQDLAKSFSRLVNFCHKLLPYQVLSLGEESSVESCPTILADKNRELSASLQHFNTALNKISTCLKLLAMQSKAGQCHPLCSQARMFRMMCRALDQLHEASRDLSKVYNAKVSLEHQMPWATPKLKMMDECVVSSLVSLVTSTNKLSSLLAEQLEFLVSSAELGRQAKGQRSATDSLSAAGPRCHPHVTHFQRRTAHFLAALNAQPRPECVPHRVAVSEQCVVVRCAEGKEGLGRRVGALQDKGRKLEQEKEHLALELQLLNAKYTAEKQKAKSLERELELLRSTAGGEGTEGVPAAKGAGEISKFLPPPCPPSSSSSFLSDRRTDSMGSGGMVETSILGQVKVEGGDGGDDGAGEEDRLRRHYSSVLNIMAQHIQHADSKAVLFQAEVRALHKQLEQVDKVRTQTVDEVEAAAQTILQLQDELTTTSESYENQLSMLSDHLSGMNDTLAQQKDEIDLLRAQGDESSQGPFSRMSRKFRR